jgi:autotransporter-associated beta strand protein
VNPASGVATVDFTSGSPSIASLASSGAGTSIVVLGNSVSNSPTTLTVGGGGQSTNFAGNISDLTGLSGNSAGNLVVTGGVLTLSGSDTFTGTAVVSGGTLVLGSADALLDSTLNYNFQGGTLSFGSLAAATFGGIEGGENLLLANVGSGVVALTIGNNGPATDYSGAMEGGGSVIVAGGNITLSGQNTYTGTTSLNGGIVTVPSGGAIGTGVTRVKAAR